MRPHSYPCGFLLSCNLPDYYYYYEAAGHVPYLTSEVLVMQPAWPLTTEPVMHLATGIASLKPAWQHYWQLCSLPGSLSGTCPNSCVMHPLKPLYHASCTTSLGEGYYAPYPATQLCHAPTLLNIRYGLSCIPSRKPAWDYTKHFERESPTTRII